MINREQREILELYKAMTQADAEAKKTRIQEIQALGVFLFACGVLFLLIGMVIVKC